MKLQATSPFYASIEILQYVWHIDYKYANTSCKSAPFTFIYFDPNRCKFEFAKVQKLETKHLVKRYIFNGENEILEIVATKHPFYKILIGATSMRRLLSYREFFEIVRANPEWV